MSRYFLMLKRHALFVILICYLPHIATEPWWLFMVLLAAIGYRLIADYYSYPLIPRSIRFILIIGCLILLNEDIHSSQFLIRFLLIFIIIKCIEIQTLRDLKVLILCNFFLIFSALIVIQEIWMIIYLLIAVLANLSLMLKLSAPQVTLRQISRKTSQQLLIVIPLSLLLFYIFPRIDPLWRVPTLSKGSTGFNETMTFGSIAELFPDDSIAMRITFKKNPILNGYWRGLILNNYNGESWNSSFYNYDSFHPLQEIKANEKPDFEILLEPNQTKWLFYEGYPASAKPNLLFSPNFGLLQQNKEIISKRFAYSLKIQPAPYYILKPSEYREATQLPKNINPRLNAWAKEQFALHHNVPSFIAYLHDYIHQQPFWYTLTPPVLNDRSNQMDSFWFDTQKGFCEHYVSAVTYILRTVGIPAHVVVGYQGGQWNPIAKAIMIQRKDAHAWLEYWQEGMGWRRLDPTTFIANERIDQTIRNHQLEQLNQPGYFKMIRFYLDSVRFFSERWFLFYNQNTQQKLLENFGLGSLDKGQLLQVSIGVMIVFFIILGLIYQWRQKRMQDILLYEYHLLQKEFSRFNISTHPPATLRQQCLSLIILVPNLTTIVSSFIQRYEQLRLKDFNGNKKEIVMLLKTLRYKLIRYKRV